jgi:hypothetical protein
MKNLTCKENEMFNSLVRLGDSEELALKTVLAFRDGIKLETLLA